MYCLLSDCCNCPVFIDILTEALQNVLCIQTHKQVLASCSSVLPVVQTADSDHH